MSVKKAAKRDNCDRFHLDNMFIIYVCVLLTETTIHGNADDEADSAAGLSMGWVWKRDRRK